MANKRDNDKVVAEGIRVCVELVLRLTVAVEKASRHLGAIEESLLSIVDGNDKTLRMKDVDRARVYSTHLGKKLKS